MKNKDNPADELRRRAERRITESSPLSPDEMQKMLHELQVHQIELEMQNDELRRVQQELETARMGYFDLHDLAPSGYLTLSEQDLILEANLTAATFFGVARGELIKQPMTRFIFNEDQDLYYLHRKQLIKTLAPQSCELRVVKHDGLHVWVYLASSTARDADGVLVFLSVLSNIDERKQAESALLESNNRYLALFQDTRDAILTADMNGKLQEINRAGERLLGYSRDEILLRNVVDIHPTTELAMVRKHFEVLAKNGRAEPLETKILRKDGCIVAVEIRPTLLEINGQKIAQAVLIDLTERKRLEKEHLAKEKQQRDTLVREVHHRIKNNLQGITGILRSFAENHPETQDLLNQVISQLRGIAVIHGLQGLAVASSVRVCELTVGIAAEIGSRWEKLITVEIPAGWEACTINETEAVPLALILNELISNAVKHGAVDGQIRIIFSHEPDPGSIKLTIHNVGWLSDGFGLETANGFGNGLQLVASLLPQAGARLTWTQQDDMVVTTLGLDEPIIHLESLTVGADER